MKLLPSLDSIDDEFFIRLPHYGVISVSGEQRNEFLHGQLTVDVKKLSNDHARRAAHCDFKGKAWALVTLCRHDDVVWISVAKDALDISMAQLNKYGVFSRIEINNCSDSIEQIAAQGPAVETFIQRHFSNLPEAPLDAVSSNLGVVIRQDHPHTLFWLLLTREGADALLQEMSAHQVTEYSQEVYEALAIKHGIPHVTGDNINQFVPQMMNVQALNGIDFNKGCYMGQEVVARTRFLGKNKRAALAFRVPEATKVNIGDMVEKQLNENWRRSGTVIRKSELEKETWLLVVAPNDTTSEDIHRLSSQPDVMFSASELPYSIEQK